MENVTIFRSYLNKNGHNEKENISKIDILFFAITFFCRDIGMGKKIPGKKVSGKMVPQKKKSPEKFCLIRLKN